MKFWTALTFATLAMRWEASDAKTIRSSSSSSSSSSSIDDVKTLEVIESAVGAGVVVTADSEEELDGVGFTFEEVEEETESVDKSKPAKLSGPPNPHPMVKFSCNNQSKEAVAIDVLCSIDYGLSYKRIKKTVPKGQKIFVCNTNYDYVYCYGKGQKCEYKGTECKKGVCYKKDFIPNTPSVKTDTWTIKGC